MHYTGSYSVEDQGGMNTFHKSELTRFNIKYIGKAQKSAS